MKSEAGAGICAFMPELAEVHWFARRWAPGVRRRVESVEAPPSRVFRHEPAHLLARELAGRTLLACESRGKRAAFRFSRDLLLGVHLGMTGRLFVESERAEAPRFFGDGEAWRLPLPKHDRLTLRLSGGVTLVFNDPRMFGEVRLHLGDDEPDWWRAAGPDPASPEYDEIPVRAAVRRGLRAPVKALLLRQDLFPGVGNWMADEILFHAGLRPDRPAGSLSDAELDALFAATREVCRVALATVGEGAPPPADWLFHQRWDKRGHCPASGVPLSRQTVAGRTSCWSQARQR